MDDERPPLAPPLLLSQPAVRAPNENLDAAVPSETTGEMVSESDSWLPERRSGG